MYIGVLHADRKVALTQTFPGIAAVLSLAAVAVAWAMHLGLLAFVVAAAVVPCAPYWLAHIWGRGALRTIRTQRDSGVGQMELGDGPPARQLRPRDLLVMSGAAAPPLYSTGLDPIVLSISRGPALVAAYGLASRIGLLVTLLPSALYPVYWANFSCLRSQGDIQRIRNEFRKELLLVVAGTTVLGAVFVAAGPRIGAVLSAGKVARPTLLYWSVRAIRHLDGCTDVDASTSW